MNFIQKQHLVFLEIGQDGRQVALNLDRGPGGLLEADAQLIRNDVGQRCLAQSWRTGKQNVIERLAAIARRLQRNRQLLLGLALPDELIQPLRAQLQVQCEVILDGLSGNDAVR